MAEKSIADVIPLSYDIASLYCYFTFLAEGKPTRPNKYRTFTEAAKTLSNDASAALGAYAESLNTTSRVAGNINDALNFLKQVALSERTKELAVIKAFKDKIKDLIPSTLLNDKNPDFDTLLTNLENLSNSGNIGNNAEDFKNFYEKLVILLNTTR